MEEYLSIQVSQRNLTYWELYHDNLFPLPAWSAVLWNQLADTPGPCKSYNFSSLLAMATCCLIFQLRNKYIIMLKNLHGHYLEKYFWPWYLAYHAPLSASQKVRFYRVRGSNELVPTIDSCCLLLSSSWASVCCGSHEEDSMHAYFKVSMRLGMAGVHIPSIRT